MTGTSRDLSGTDPGGVVPDTKDWTWVLQQVCPECGFLAESVSRAGVAARLTDATAAWVGLLSGLTPEDVRRRPDAGTWSPLEYACHVRDTLRLFEARLALMLEQDDPEFANWDQDATALAAGYAAQSPVTVRREVAEAGQRTAEAFAAVPPQAWQRPGRRSNGSTFTVESLGRYLLHDVEHHLSDVAAG